MRGWFGNRDVCRDGAPWRKPTSLYSSNAAISEISGTCNCGWWVSQIRLVGVCPQAGENWTKIAGPYWHVVVRTVEKTAHDHAYQ